MEEPTQCSETQYEVVESTCTAEGCEATTVYGIAVNDGSTRKILIADVSSIREVVADLVERCNRCGVCESQIKDIMIDFLP